LSVENTPIKNNRTSRERQRSIKKKKGECWIENFVGKIVL